MQDRQRISRKGAAAKMHRLCASLASGVCLVSLPAAAAEIPGKGSLVSVLAMLDRHDIMALATTTGVVGFAAFASTLLIRTRRRADANDRRLRQDLRQAQAEAERAQALLMADPQVVIAWPAGDNHAEIAGDTSLMLGEARPSRILAFGTWLAPEPALAMDHAVDGLRSSGESFSMTLPALNGRTIEASGRAISGQAVVRLRELTGIRRELAETTLRQRAALDELEKLRSFVDSLPWPVWTRSAEGALSFANAAYAAAVDAPNGTDAVARNLELLDSDDRTSIAQSLTSETHFAGRMPVVVSGERRTCDVHATLTRTGSAGIAIDMSEAATLRAELSRMAEAHRRTLDQLATAVAIFDGNRRLAFHNEAYRRLWDLPPAFLENAPGDSAILDQLRAARKLPEEQDFRQWKQRLHEAYQAIEAQQSMWHLPDGRTLRVVTTPNPEGGVTYLFEDVTERLDLERRFDSLIRVQRETLDNLAEGVAVFGSNGCLRLHNPAFAALWRLDAANLDSGPHIEAIIGLCSSLYADESAWQTLRSAVTGIDDRTSIALRMERSDGSVLDCMTTPLPDGATMLSFQDATDSVNVERALIERNDALEEADKIKVDFVHHVSYELRSPLTTIIGFAHFLGDPATGPLTPKQRDYLEFITVSTNALLAIINNILDLATIDAGGMTLNLVQVDIAAMIAAAAEGVQDRLVKDNIALDFDVAQDIGVFTADERRVVQVLYNLLANAAGFSPPGSKVRLSARRQDHHVVFSVTDSGPGIPPEMRDSVFNWFESHANGSRHRGAGLGLSLVRSFVELHGGSVHIESSAGAGTTVTCEFPLQPAIRRDAAE